MDELITIATFGQAHELAVVRARLEWEGIPCYLKDEFTVQAHPFYSNAIGGIKLQVAREDVRPALDILVEAGVLDGEGARHGREEQSNTKILTLPRTPTFSTRQARRIAWVVIALVLVLAILLM
jgi:hypothetical protein